MFFAGQVLPGDPGRSILGPLAAPSAVKALDHQLGVDKPLLSQYWHWITHFSGTSQQYQAPIGPILTTALGTLAEARDASRSSSSCRSASSAACSPR